MYLESHKFFKLRISISQFKLFSLFANIAVICSFSSCESKHRSVDAITSTYSKEERLYFIETAYEKDFDYIIKWNRPTITYSITGIFNDDDIAFIKATCDNISIDGLPKFQYSKSNSDIVFYMPNNPEEVQTHYRDFYGDKETSIKGMMVPTAISDNGYFQSAKIYIKPRQSKLDIQITIHHELLHALGLMGHPTSSFAETTALGVRYFTLESRETISPILPKLDISAVRLLYNNAVKVKENKKSMVELVGLNR